jgi:dATP pyrophosphohydrolase
VPLASRCSIPTTAITASSEWSKDLLVITEFAFAVDCTGLDVGFSPEHQSIRWGPYEAIRDLLSYDSNRTALWELTERLRLGLIGEA